MVCFSQTIHLQIFLRLSSTNFTWSILEYFDLFQIQSFNNLPLGRAANNKISSVPVHKSIFLWVIKIKITVFRENSQII